MTAFQQAIEPQTPRWYLLQCKPRQDSRAEEHLKRQGYLCYRPTHNIEHIHQGKRQTLRDSLFPGYIFIRLNRYSDNWHPIRSTRGVSRIVSFGNSPAWLKDEWIEQLRRREQQDTKATAFEKGDRVILNSPGFESIEAIFFANDGEQRVIILLSVLQQEQSLRVPVSSISKI